MTNRIIAMSDIHGCVAEFEQALRIMDLKKTDTLVLIGDLIDRGPDSKSVLDTVYRLKQAGYDVCYLRGNHEQAMLDAFLHNQNGPWIRSGGIKTLESYVGKDFPHNQWSADDVRMAKEWIRKHYAHHLELIKESAYYYQSQKHVFVHAGLDPKFGLRSSSHDMINIREEFYRTDLKFPFKVVFGHTPVHRIERNLEEPWIQADKIGMDGGISFGKQLHVLVLSNNEQDMHTISIFHENYQETSVSIAS